MNPKSLLSQLTRLEHTLNDFSFEELTAAEASHLKKSFQAFRVSLENKIYSPSRPLEGTSETDFQEINKSQNSEEPDNQSSNANAFVARVSHEIRTPLNGILGFADLLKEDELTEKQLERVNAIQTASNSLMEIINELLEYSKLSAGIEKFESVDFNLKNLVDNVMYLCDTLVIGKSIKLSCTIDKSIPDNLKGDPSRLSQILLNLIGNSVKFVEQGCIDVAIKLKSQKENQFFLAFSIADTGIGISKKNLEHIFEAYTQAEDDTQSKYGGSGLGLSIVKQIVDKLAGDISVESVLGKGTTFHFVLPYESGNTESIPKEVAPKNSSKDLLDEIKGLRILVFEDNALNQKLIEQRLKSWKCNVFVTDNALYGINILETNQIDMILMDLKMPKMSGFEVGKRIRESKIDEIRKLPIIAVSADFSQIDQEELIGHKFNDFILKPYTSDELLSKLIKNKKAKNKALDIDSKALNREMEVYVDATKINLSVILEDCLGQIDLLEELVMLYKQNALEFIGVMKINLENDDLDEIAFAAHKIKSGLTMMQSHRLSSIAEQIQKICKTTGNREHLRFLYDYFVEEYPLVQKAIDEQVEALKNN